MTADDINDISVAIVDRLVISGIIKDCTDTDDELEFEIQDIIREVIHQKTNTPEQ